ncbi:hypothetical protein LUQ84_000740 [Hamiltosporidium tvaerminnensis]|nr:hypothetical protein LUQ84_000740 [Hamiltosporidium tvaerminnensis]
MNGDKNGDGDIGSRDIGSRDIGIRDIGIGDIGSRDIGIGDSYNRDIGIGDIGIGDKTLIDNKFTGKKSISNNLTDTYKSNNITLSLPRSVNMCNITNIHNYGAECLLVGKNIFYLEIENEFKKIKIEFEKVFNFNGKIVVLKDNLLVAYVVRRIEEYMLSSVEGEYVGGEVDKIDNSDKIENKVDEIEDKVDKIENKVDELEDKVDRIDEIYDIPDKKYIPDTPNISYDTPLYRLVGECCMVRQVSINKCEIMCFDREKEKFCKNVNFYKENIFIEDFIDINVVDEHTIVLYRDSSGVSNKQYEARKYKDREYKDREYKDWDFKDNIFMIRVYKEKAVLFDYKINGECTSMCCYSNKIFIGLKEKVENPCYRILSNIMGDKNHRDGTDVNTPIARGIHNNTPIGDTITTLNNTLLATHLPNPIPNPNPLLQKHFLHLFEIGKKSLLLKNRIYLKSEIIIIKTNVKYIFIVTKRNSLIVYDINLLTPVIQDILHKHIIYLECINIDTIFMSDKLGNIFICKIGFGSNMNDGSSRDNTKDKNNMFNTDMTTDLNTNPNTNPNTYLNTSLDTDITINLNTNLNTNLSFTTLISYYIGDIVIKIYLTKYKIYYFTSFHKFGCLYYLNEKEFNLYEILEEEILKRQKCFNNYNEYYNRFYCRKNVIDKEYLKKFYRFEEKDKLSVQSVLGSKEVGCMEMLIDKY